MTLPHDSLEPVAVIHVPDAVDRHDPTLHVDVGLVVVRAQDVAQLATEGEGEAPAAEHAPGKRSDGSGARMRILS